jgi:serine/threonine protein kinase
LEIKYSTKTDVYSSGIVLLEIFSRKPAWKQFNPDYVIKGGFPEMHPDVFNDHFENGEIMNLIVKEISNCLVHDPEERCSMETVHGEFRRIETFLGLSFSLDEIKFFAKTN